MMAGGGHAPLLTLVPGSYKCQKKDQGELAGLLKEEPRRCYQQKGDWIDCKQEMSIRVDNLPIGVILSNTAVL